MTRGATGSQTKRCAEQLHLLWRLVLVFVVLPKDEILVDLSLSDLIPMFRAEILRIMPAFGHAKIAAALEVQIGGSYSEWFEPQTFCLSLSSSGNTKTLLIS